MSGTASSALALPRTGGERAPPATKEERSAHDPRVPHVSHLCQLYL